MPVGIEEAIEKVSGVRAIPGQQKFNGQDSQNNLKGSVKAKTFPRSWLKSWISLSAAVMI